MLRVLLSYVWVHVSTGIRHESSCDSYVTDAYSSCISLGTCMSVMSDGNDACQLWCLTYICSCGEPLQGASICVVSSMNMLWCWLAGQRGGHVLSSCLPRHPTYVHVCAHAVAAGRCPIHMMSKQCSSDELESIDNLYRHVRHVGSSTPPLCLIL